MNENEEIKQTEETFVSQHMQQKAQHSKIRRAAIRVRKIIVWTTLIFVFLLAAIYFLFQQYWLQNYLAQQAADYLSKELHTKVEIDGLQIDLFNQLSINGLYIEDLQHDTLLYAGRLNANLDMKQLYYQQVLIDNITLQDAVANIKRPAGSPTFNFQFIVDYFSPKKKKTKTKNNWEVRLGSLTLQNIKVDYLNARIGQHITTSLPLVSLIANHISLQQKIIDIQNLAIEAPNIQFNKYFRDSLTQYPPPVPKDTAKMGEKDTTAWVLRLTGLSLKKGGFALNDTRHKPSEKPATFDPHRIGVKNINFSVKNIALDTSNTVLEGFIATFNANEKSGFAIKTGKGNLSVSSTAIQLNKALITTPNSSLSDSIKLSYSDFQQDFAHFVNQVRLDLRLKNTYIGVQDILYFAYPLQKNALFKRRFSDKIFFDGRVYGTINNLKSRNVRAKWANTSLAGNFDFKDLTHPKSLYIDAEIQQLSTNAYEVISLIPPSVKIPDNIRLDKLGAINFKGHFTGYSTNFTTQGTLNTALGSLKTDLTIDLNAGDKKGSYSGNIALQNVDIGALISQKDIGRVSLTAAVEGKGVTMKTVDAKVNATIENASYKNYVYSGIKIKGDLLPNQFNGEIGFHDANADFDIKGYINFANPKKPTIQMERINIQKADLYALNLTKQRLFIRGNISEFNFVGTNIDSIIGRATLSNIVFKRLNTPNDTLKIAINTAKIAADIGLDGQRRLSLESDILNASAVGFFRLQELPNAFLDFVERNYPTYSERFNIHPKRVRTDTIESAKGIIIKQTPLTWGTQNIELKAFIKNTKDLLPIFAPKIGIKSIEDTNLHIRFKSDMDSLYAFVDVPKLTVNDLIFYNQKLNLKTHKSYSLLMGKVDSTQINPKFILPRINFKAQLVSDTLAFGIDTYQVNEALQGANLAGKLFPIDSNRYQVSLLPSGLHVYNQRWDIDEMNSIRFGKEYLRVDKLTLRNGRQAISVNSIGARSLVANIVRFDLSSLNAILKNNKTPIAGTASINLAIEDIYKQKGFVIIGGSRIDSLKIANNLIGRVEVQEASMPAVGEPILLLVDLIHHQREDRRIKVAGTYIPPFLKDKKHLNNQFDLTISTNEFPVAIAETFLKDGISGTSGYFKANISLKGTPENNSMKGTVDITDGITTIKFLQTTYRVPKFHANIDDYRFDFTNEKIYDRYNNMGIFKRGAITHNHFKNFGLDILITSPKMELINTQAKDNTTFYGTGIGAAEVRITGSFTQTDMNIKAKVDKGTHLVLPLTGQQEVKAVNFIKFIKKDTTTVKPLKSKEGRGLNLDLYVTTTPLGQIELIFNEAAGEKIQAQGDGEIALHLTRFGDFTMFGDYNITSGSYLFNYQNVVNKPFAIEKGSTIVWTGSPYDAQIDVKASYKNLKVPPIRLIEDITSDLQSLTLARNSTDVKLDMLLRGSMLKPDINFNIDLPAVEPAIRGLVQEKLRLIREDPNELNRQVFSLVVMRNFMSTGGGITGTAGVTSINTVTEMFSNQLSSMVTDIISQAIGDNRYISGIDFDLNYKLNEADTETGSAGSAVQLGLKNYFFNNRLLVNVGGNIDIGQSAVQQQSGAYFAGNFMIEYLITADGRYRVRAYTRDEPDIAVNNGSRRNRSGIGLSYRREFDSMNAFFEGLRRDVIKVAEEKKKNQNQ